MRVRVRVRGTGTGRGRGTGTGRANRVAHLKVPLAQVAAVRRDRRLHARVGQAPEADVAREARPLAGSGHGPRAAGQGVGRAVRAPWARPRRLCRGAVTEGAALEPRGLALRVDELGLAGRHAGGHRVRRGRGAQVHVLEARSVATWLSPSSCGGRAAAPAARPYNSTAKRRTRPPWYASASKHEVACPSATWPSPPVLAQVEAGTDCGRSWPRSAAAGCGAAPSSQANGSSATAGSQLTRQISWRFRRARSNIAGDFAGRFE